MLFRKIFSLNILVLKFRPKCWVNIKVKVQKAETTKAQLGTLEIMYVQYDCNPSSSFRDLLRKRSVCQNIQIDHSTPEPKVDQSSYTPKCTTRPPLVV